MQIFQKVKSGGMSICVSCAYRKVCKGIDNQPCVECNRFFNEDKHPQTNADRIRALSDEELANVLTDYSNNGGWITEAGRQICYERIIEWLQQRVEGD